MVPLGMAAVTLAAPLAAVIYGRQSQDNDRSIKDQLTLGDARVAAEGWQTTGRYCDGVSASRYVNKERDDWLKVLAAVESGKPDVLWLWESSRGDRTLSTWAALLESCRDHGVRIYVETHGRLYDMANARDFRTLAEDGVDSVWEVDKTSQRVRREMLANAVAGKVHGRIPYGYRREYKFDPVTGKRKIVGQVPDEAEAKVVKRIFADLAAGVPLVVIVRKLNKDGVQTRGGKMWSMSQVRFIALNRIYIGQRLHDPEGRRAGLRKPGPSATFYSATWPPLVDEETFWAVHRILSDPARLTHRPEVTPRPGKAKHLLSMIAQCGECGETLSATFTKRGGPRYRCPRSCVLINMADLDDYVTAEVLARVARPEQWERLVAAGNTDDQELAAVNGEVDKLRAALGEFRQLARARKITPASFAAIEPGILADLEKAEARARELRTPPQLRWLAGDGPADLAARWSAAPVAARRDAIRQLAAVTVARSPRRGPVSVPAAQRTIIEWITGEPVAPSGN